MALFEINKNTFEKSVNEYVNEITKGNYEIPAFQREYVWVKQHKKITDLLDSINKGFNIGTTVFWESNHKINRKNDSLGNSPDEYGFFNYIVDGQQRTLTLVSLFYKDNFLLDQQNYFVIYDKKNKELVFSHKRPTKNEIYMNLHQFNIRILRPHTIKFNYKDEYKGKDLDDINLFEKKLKKFKDKIKIDKIIIGYKLNVFSNDISIAINQFERINSAGIKLNEFEILSAMAFSDSEYDLKSVKHLKYIRKIDGVVDREGRWTNDSKKIILNSYKLFKNYILDDNGNQGKVNLSANSIARFEEGDAKILENIISLYRDFLAEISYMNIKSIKDMPYTHNATLYIFIKKHCSYPDEIKDSDFIFKIMFQTGIQKSYDKSASQKLISHIKKTLEQVNSSLEISLVDSNAFDITDTTILNTNYKSIGPVEKAVFLYWIYVKDLLDFETRKKITLDGLFRKSVNIDHLFPKSNPKFQDTATKREHTLANLSLISQRTNIYKTDKIPSNYFSSLPFIENEDIYESQYIDEKGYEFLIQDRSTKFINHRAEIIAADLSEYIKKTMYDNAL